MYLAVAADLGEEGCRVGDFGRRWRGRWLLERDVEAPATDSGEPRESSSTLTVRWVWWERARGLTV